MRWTRDIWVQIIQQYEASGLTQEEYAEQRGIPVGTLRSWIYRLRREGQDEAPLLPVRVIGSPAPLGAAAVDEATPAIEVELGSSVRLRFPAGTAPGVIAEVVGLLRARC